MGIAFFVSFFLFVNASWSINMKAYGHWKFVSYILLHINFIQSFSFNYWIIINFAFQNVVMKKFKCFACV
jgi:hypothetical protein